MWTRPRRTTPRPMFYRLSSHPQNPVLDYFTAIGSPLLKNPCGAMCLRVRLRIANDNTDECASALEGMRAIPPVSVHVFSVTSELPPSILLRRRRNERRSNRSGQGFPHRLWVLPKDIVIHCVSFTPFEWGILALC